ncbi:D-alanyl-D-alanine carboxypeptidase family protein [Mycoplasmatota bacterium WC44]
MKKILITFLFTVIYVYSSLSVNANTEIIEDGQSSILIEMTTGKILYQKNAQEMRAPASMTKVMTMILILEAIENGQFSFDDLQTISENAASLGGSQIYLEAGEVMTVRDLFKSVAISSANDAATALAEKVAGSEKVFVDLMNQKVKELGLSSTQFKDPTGLSDEGHYTSAYDMAIMAQYLLTTYPYVTEYTNTYEDYVRDGDFWLVNTNKLVRNDDIDGVKTGWTEAAGYCLTATKFSDSMRVIGVIMGSTNTKIRNAEMQTLLNYGMSNFNLTQKMEEGSIVKSETNINLEPTELNYRIKYPVNIVLRNGTEMEEVKYKIDINYDNLTSNKDIGNLSVFYNNEIYQVIPLYLEEEVEKTSYFGLLKKVLKLMLAV